MLDIKLLRNNPQEVKKGLQRRGKNYDEFIESILQIDEERRILGSKRFQINA